MLNSILTLNQDPSTAFTCRVREGTARFSGHQYLLERLDSKVTKLILLTVKDFLKLESKALKTRRKNLKRDS